MRLKQKEITAIVKSFQIFFPDLVNQLYLFGSRADDSKRGGDIDLLIVVETSEQKSLLVDSKIRIKMKIFETLDEQKIDITVATRAELNSDPFLKQIFPGAILLG